MTDYDSSYDNDRVVPPLQMGQINLGPIDTSLNRFNRLPTVEQVQREKQRPSASQRDAREELSKAILDLITKFTEETGLLVEDIDVELDDTFSRRNPHTRYEAIQIKAVLP